MNIETIENTLNLNLSKIDETSDISSKISLIESSQTLVQQGEQILNQYQQRLDNYHSHGVSREIKLGDSISFIEQSIENIDNLSLDDSMAIYERVMDEMTNIELFMEQKKKEFELIE